MWKTLNIPNLLTLEFRRKFITCRSNLFLFNHVNSQHRAKQTLYLVVFETWNLSRNNPLKPLFWWFIHKALLENGVTGLYIHLYVHVTCTCKCWKLVRNRGVRMQVVDPRWNNDVDWDEWDDDRQLSLKEIVNCKEESIGPTFVVRQTSHSIFSDPSSCFLYTGAAWSAIRRTRGSAFHCGRRLRCDRERSTQAPQPWHAWPCTAWPLVPQGHERFTTCLLARRFCERKDRTRCLLRKTRMTSRPCSTFF